MCRRRAAVCAQPRAVKCASVFCSQPTLWKPSAWRMKCTVCSQKGTVLSCWALRTRLAERHQHAVAGAREHQCRS